MNQVRPDVVAREFAACTPEEKARVLADLRSCYQPSGTEARVCEDIARRQAMGVAKYGTTVERNPLPLRDWLQHAYEEALDLAIYLRRSIEQLEPPLQFPAIVTPGMLDIEEP
jgi:hypothetical protein